jgi:hypothetical protein
MMPASRFVTLLPLVWACHASGEVASPVAPSPPQPKAVPKPVTTGAVTTVAVPPPDDETNADDAMSFPRDAAVVRDEHMHRGAMTSVIQRVVRQSFGRMRNCYAHGLRRDESLRRRVTTRFTILTDGSVAGIEDAGSSLHDPRVIGCVQRVFAGLSFPELRSALVITYPIAFYPMRLDVTERS